MSKLSSADRELLKGLYSSVKGVDIYDFHVRYLLSPGQISSFVRRYSLRGFVAEKGDLVRLTPKGRRWLLKNRQRIFLQERQRVWAIPRVSGGKTIRLAPFEPYLPVLGRVDRSFFLSRRVDESGVK